jgi:hypothetical protein
MPNVSGIKSDILFNRRKELIADHYYLHVAYNRLKTGKKWGEWTLKDVIKWHDKVTDKLLKLGYKNMATSKL